MERSGAPGGIRTPTLCLEDLGFENLNILIEKSKGKEEIHDLIPSCTRRDALIDSADKLRMAWYLQFVELEMLGALVA
jgi:hypothetical protein